MADTKPGPLHGVRIVDLTRILSGPFCTMILGDLGADVIKIEPPKGDPVRVQGTLTDGCSGYFAGFNRNKRSVVLDLYNDAGKDALRRLIETADVMVENFRPGTLAKMGFGADALKELNPRLIVASVNGYGSNGPYVDRPAFDFIAQAMSGFMSTNGDADGPPYRTAAPVSDLIAGLYTVIGIIASLHGRQQTGEGQTVEVAMVNGLLSIMAYLSSEYFATGQVLPRSGNDHPLVAPYGLYRCADGEVAIAPSNDEIVRRLMRALELDWVLRDPRYDNNEGRRARRDEIRQLIETRMAGQTREYWLNILNDAGVPAGFVQDLEQVFSDPQIMAQEMVIQTPVQNGPDLKVLGFPIKLGSTPCRIHRPVPGLGGGTEEVLQELGYTPEEIEENYKKNDID